MSSSTSLQVFVHFKEETVFAGEPVDCVITFKNVETIKKQGRPLLSPRVTSSGLKATNPLDQLRAARGPAQPSLTRRDLAVIANQPAAHARHPSAFSDVDSAGKQPVSEVPGGGFHIASAASEKQHARTVSIISLGGTAASQYRPVHKHARSASAKLTTDIRNAGRRPRPSLSGHRSMTGGGFRSPLLLTPSPLSESDAHSQEVPNQNRPLQTPLPANGTSFLQSSKGPRSDSAAYQFDIPLKTAHVAHPTMTTDIHDDGRTLDAVAPDRSSTAKSYFGDGINGQTLGKGDDSPAPLTRVFSVRSTEGTPRSSLDIASNHSNETSMSELPSFHSLRLLETPRLSRRSSLAGQPPTTEVILMGYAQLSGFFTLDGSLINQGPFEDVKRRAVVGGQGGGGVVGINPPATDSGTWGSLNWKSIGESLGGFMGGSGPSSMKEMKGIAKSDSIPLLSTSKSILFVNLSLAPGESRSYSYQFSLPRGLPPSHKGRAIKVSYNLVIGTHRAGSRNEQPQLIKQVEIPFRVLSGVNAHGEYLGHDLMSPYVILKDQARTTSIHGADAARAKAQLQKPDLNVPSSSAAEFQVYVDHLLTRPRSNSSRGLLSPTAEHGATSIPITPQTTQIPHIPHIPHRRQASRSPDGPLPKASILIDEAIRQSTNPTSAIYSPTSFTIARSSIPIASLMLSRPALKMGDTLTCVIDFSTARLPCYALEATLESSEKVDPTLAIRSPQSVERATRRIWASTMENTIWTRRCVFRAQVPFHATPAFVTSGVSLEWSIRLELVVGLSRPQSIPTDEVHDTQSSVATLSSAERVLEVTDADERGTVLAAKQYLPCESFEVEIPLRVFGAVVTGPEVDTEMEGLRI